MSLPFHKKCKPTIEKMIAKLDVTSAWVCQVNLNRETAQVTGFGVGPAANPMEKVSDLFEEYDLNTTPQYKNWLCNKPQENLIFQIKTMPANNPDRREYAINRVNTVLFAPIYVQNELWGVIEVWETRRPRKFGEDDLIIIQNTVDKIARELEA